MSVMPALKLKLRDSQSALKSKVANKKSNKRSAKVIELFKHKKASTGLSSKSREELVIKYQLKARKVAFSILRRWHARLDLQEVHSIVDLSLCEAVKRYNPSKGASFMTFLFYHLRGNLIRAVTIAAKQNTIPLADFAEPRLGWEDETESARESDKDNKSVTAQEVADALSNREHPLPDEVLIKKELVRASLEACEALDNLEREVLFRIYLQEEPLLDVAASLGYSRCHISRVKRSAINALQRSFGAKVQDSEWTPTFADQQEESGIEAEAERKVIHRRRPRSGQKKCKLSKRTLTRSTAIRPASVEQIAA